MKVLKEWSGVRKSEANTLKRNKIEEQLNENITQKSFENMLIQRSSNESELIKRKSSK